MLARNVEKPESWSIADGKVKWGCCHGAQAGKSPSVTHRIPMGSSNYTPRDLNKTESRDSERHGHSHLHISVIHNSQEMETTQCLSTDKWKNKCRTDM